VFPQAARDTNLKRRDYLELQLAALSARCTYMALFALIRRHQHPN
jgi:hypothetical protein